MCLYFTIIFNEVCGNYKYDDACFILHAKSTSILHTCCISLFWNPIILSLLGVTKWILFFTLKNYI